MSHLNKMRSKEIEAYKEGLKLSELQKEVLIGMLLGDGHLETQNGGRTYRLKVEHSYLQKEYVDWLYQVFKEWVTTPPRERTQIVLGVSYQKYGFSTLSHGGLRFYAQQFYQNKKKVLPRMIHKWLSPIAMAVWYMDDGSIKSSHHRALIINTQRFSMAELKRLVIILKDKYGVEMKLRKQSRKSIEIYQLITTSDTVVRFVDTIRPHVLPSMKYKLGILGNTIA